MNKQFFLNSPLYWQNQTKIPSLIMNLLLMNLIFLKYSHKGVNTQHQLKSELHRIEE